MQECCNSPWIVDINFFELWHYSGLKFFLTSYIRTYERGSRSYILLEVRVYSLCSQIPHLLSIFILSAGPLRNRTVFPLEGHLLHSLRFVNSKVASSEFLRFRVCYSVSSPVESTEMNWLPGSHPLIPVHWLFLFSLLCWIYIMSLTS